MSLESQRPLVNGRANRYANGNPVKSEKTVEKLKSKLGAAAKDHQAQFHGNKLLKKKQIIHTKTLLNIRLVFTQGNAKQIWEVLSMMIMGQGLDLSEL